MSNSICVSESPLLVGSVPLNLPHRNNKSFGKNLFGLQVLRINLIY